MLTSSIRIIERLSGRWVLPAIIVAISGCTTAGGITPADAERVVRDYWTAYSKGAASEACPLLTADAKATMIDSWNAAAAAELGRVESCDAMVLKSSEARITAGAPPAEVTAEAGEPDGDTISVDYELADDEAGTLTLTRYGDELLISGVQ